MDMELTYIYHSGFALSGDGFTVIMDYYRDSEDGQAQADLNRLMDGTFSNQEAGMPEGTVHSELLRRPGKLYVLASHFHPDHFNKEVLQWREQRPDIIYIFSKDILRHRRAQKEDAVWLKKGEEYKDETLSVRAFGSTDVGVSFLLQAGGKKIFHAGDLNNWHWKEESTEEEVCEAENTYLAELEILARRTDRMDLVMFPVDPRLGLEYMLGAKQFVDRFRVGMFVPMHFDEEYVRANAFREYAESRGVRFVELTYRGEEVKI